MLYLWPSLALMTLFLPHVSPLWRRLGLAVLMVGILGSRPALAQPRAAAADAPVTIRLQPEDVQRGQNGSQSNFFFLPPGTTGENYVGAGFFGQRLRPYLGNNTEALEFLADYRRQKTLYLLERLVFMGAAGLYGQQVLARDERQYFNSTQQVAVGVAVTSLLANIFISRNTNIHLQRAVEAYNTEVDGSKHRKGWQRLRPSNMGLQGTSRGQPMLALRWSLR